MKLQISADKLNNHSSPVELMMDPDKAPLGMKLKRFGIGWVPPDEEGRKVHEGPLVKGPWIFAYGLETVLHNGPYEGPTTTLVVEEGDVVEIVHKGEVVVSDTIKIERGYVLFEKEV